MVWNSDSEIGIRFKRFSEFVKLESDIELRVKLVYQGSHRYFNNFGS